MKSLIIAVLWAVTSFASVTCFYHSYASCYNTGETEVLPDGGMAYRYHCTCGDDVWVR